MESELTKRLLQAWTFLLVAGTVASVAFSRLTARGMKTNKTKTDHLLCLQTSKLKLCTEHSPHQNLTPLRTPGSVSSEPVQLPFDLHDLSLPLWQEIDGLLNHWIASHHNLEEASSQQQNKTLAVFIGHQDLSFLQELVGFNALYKAEEGLVGHGRPTQLECYPKLR
jgi:hypothetical protein